MSPSLIVGIDPGSRKTGFGVVSYEKGRLQYVTSGCIKLTQSDLGARLVDLHENISTILQTYCPQYAVIEDIFMGANWRSALTLGQARGVLYLACQQRGVSVTSIAARYVKKAVTGSGASTKKSVNDMVVRLLDLHAAPQEDAADALALAIAGAHQQRINI